MKTICVIGLGYIGLPTASVLASNGFQVTGVDVNPTVVETINQGRIHIEEPGLKTIVAAAIGSGNFKASLMPVEADVFILAVPTPFTEDKKADMIYVERATRAILPLLRPGNLVVLESTSPPMTTRDLIVPILAESGLDIGNEVFVAHCPERVLPGRILKELIDNDRVIGGITHRSAQIAREVYASFVEGHIHLTDATTAEMVKLMENTYRDVNIALANELALMAEQAAVSAWDVIRLANLHPRVNLHQPGPGVGGHCISVDPWFLVEKFPATAKIVRMARAINDHMPHVVVDKILRLLQGVENPRVTALGLSYKGNVDDLRESPSVEIVKALMSKGIEVRVYDPHIREWDYELWSLESAFQGSDIAVLLTDHIEYKYLYPKSVGALMRRKILLDTRAALDLNTWQESGFDIHLHGAGGKLSFGDQKEILHS